MSSYTIHARNQTLQLVEQGGIVRRCSIEFFEGLSFDEVRTLFEKKGWVVVPDVEDPTNIFQFKGSTYELRWRGNKITTIVKDDEEISWEELPEELKGLL